MSRQGSVGRQRWHAQRVTFAQELAGRITADATDQMQRWSERGRIPWWVRAKARLRHRVMQISLRIGMARRRGARRRP